LARFLLAWPTHFMLSHAMRALLSSWHAVQAARRASFAAPAVTGAVVGPYNIFALYIVSTVTSVGQLFLHAALISVSLQLLTTQSAPLPLTPTPALGALMPGE